MTPPLEVKTIDGRLWYVDVTVGKPDRKIAPYPSFLAPPQAGGGTQGNPGLSAYQVALLSGFNGTVSQWLTSLKSTEPGVTGQDAYQVAVTGGFVGTRAAWLTSLQGPASTVPGPAAVAGRLEANTTNTPGNIYMRILNSWKLLRPSSHEKAQGVIAICDKNRDMIENGNAVDLTGLGFQDGGVYYVEDPDAGGKNLALTPVPLTTAQTPTLSRSFLSAGPATLFGAQTLLSFRMQANILEGAAYAQLTRTIFADLVYNVTPTLAQIGRLIDTQAAELTLNRLLADGDASAQGAFLETSPVTRSLGGTVKGVFLQDVGFGGLHVRIPAGWEVLGAGDYLLTYAQSDNDNAACGPVWGATATDLHSAIFYGGTGLIDYVVIQRGAVSGATVTNTSLSQGAITTGCNKLRYFHVRLNISADRLTVKVKVWPRNAAKPLERQDEDEPAAFQYTFTSATAFPIGAVGWCYSNGSIRRVMASRSPNPLIKAPFVDQI